MRVLVLGLAKSGTTALAYKIHEALGRDAALHFEPGKTTGAEDTALHARLTAAPGSMITKNLVFPTDETRWHDVFANADRYDRAIWIVRDPRDIIISNFFYHWYGHHSTREKFEEALARTRRKESDPTGTPFVDLVAGTMTDSREQLAAWQSNWYGILGRAAAGIRSHLHVLRYEDFVDGRLDAVSAYLGLELAGDATVPDEHRRVARTRGYDNWRRWFTAEDVDFFRPIVSDFLRTMGYDADDWTLVPMSSLPADEGSGYMKKLRENRASAPARSLLRRAAARLASLAGR